MSKKYIGEIQNDNFIFPNNNPWEYGVEIIHDINDYSVSGTVTNFVATVTGSSINVAFDYTWAKNNAEPFITDSDLLSVLSVHMMEPTTTFFKPWRLVGNITNALNYLSNITSSVSFTVTPAEMGVTSFINGTYYFEVRMIGHRAIYPICVTYTVSTFPTPTPTVTPTPTPTGPTPTPTPTPTPGITYYSGATLNVTDTGWIKYDIQTLGTAYQYIDYLGTYTINSCVDCSSIRQGIPYADLANFTITTCGAPCAP
jgi:hypothetical protein